MRTTLDARSSEVARILDPIEIGDEHTVGQAQQHATFTGLEPGAMIAAGNTAPLHEGARRYYRERGWLPDD